MATIGKSQNIQITLGPDEIGENQAWTITVTVQNDRLKSYDNFPEIDGFRKRGTSSQSSTSIINGQISSSQSVTMTYLPMKQGIISVPPFKMSINDKMISSPGKKVKVGAPVQTQQRDPFKSFFDRDDDFFGDGNTEFVDIKEDAFLALTTSKDEVYLGEGFNTTLSLFVAESNRAPLGFYELGKQLNEILKKIRPANCWEENFNIENIEGETVSINGKYYTQYKVYQATFFPLTVEPINFPSIGLEMLKYKVAKNPSFFGQNRQEDFKKFYSKPKTVKVKELPPHPLRDAVSVGDYYLEEKIPGTSLESGKSTSYEFNIYGEGNISAIANPTVNKDGNFEFYEPNVRQSINRQKNRVAGSKSFNYFLIPREPGKYEMKNYFQWVFFNPRKEKYDTLKSKLTLTVTGESQKNQAIQSTDPGTFYDKVRDVDNTLQSIQSHDWQKPVFTVFILLMLGASAYLVLKK
ncbi:MAG TPA: BatD family protein [Cyclobacteriaceae bacterium]|nr:BatD family protein [Cyclobacteriaceae bacterium]